jgi:hypothetical protein
MVGKPDFDAEHFCTKEHNEVYAILSKHGCNLITADEALTELKAHNIDDIKLAEDAAAHVERIKSEATKEEAPIQETPSAKAVQQPNKKNKKKW